MASSPSTEVQLPEPSPEALSEAENGPARATRRGSRGGQGRKRPAQAIAAELKAAAEANQPLEEPSQEQPTSRRRGAADETPQEQPAARRRGGNQASRRKAEAEEPSAPPSEEPESAQERPSSRRRQPPPNGRTASAESQPDMLALLHAMEQQSRQIEHLARAQEELARRIGSPGHTAAPPARVGIFVDAANIELACDRIRPPFHVNWKKVFDMLTRDRQVVRAIAYCPVHDDLDVSMETQRFVEPFLDKGFKIFTKPLKRFQDNSVKANVDIEMAIDIIEMLDRLDVVCLASGDGDFQRLVELIQSRGVRVEVIGVGSSTATNLRNAADEYIDLASRMKDFRA